MIAILVIAKVIIKVIIKVTIKNALSHDLSFLFWVHCILVSYYSVSIAYMNA